MANTEEKADGTSPSVNSDGALPRRKRRRGRRGGRRRTRKTTWIDASTLELSVVRFLEKDGVLSASPYGDEAQLPRRNKAKRRKNFEELRFALADEALHIARNVAETNAGQRVKRSLESYAHEIKKPQFNARLLDFRTSSLHYGISHPEISQSITEWDRESITKFLQMNDEFLLEDFISSVEAMEDARELEISKDAVPSEVSRQLNAATELMNAARNRGNRHVLDDEASTLVRDIADEASERSLLLTNADGSQEFSDDWEPLTQGVLVFARFLYSVGKFGLGTVISTATIAGASAAVESQWPGAFKAIYDYFVSVYPSLPTWPF